MEKPWDSLTKRKEEILKTYRGLEIDSKTKKIVWKEKTYLPQSEIEGKKIYVIDSDNCIFLEGEEVNNLIFLKKNNTTNFSLVMSLNSVGQHQVKDVNLSLSDFLHY